MKFKLLCSAGLLALAAACSPQYYVAEPGPSRQARVGFAALERGDYAAAEAAYRAALANDSEDAYALLGLARAAEARGDLASAVQYYRSAEVAGRGEISTLSFVTAGAVDSNAQVGVSEVASQGLSRIYTDPSYVAAVYRGDIIQSYDGEAMVLHPSTVETYTQTVTSYEQPAVYSETITYTETTEPVGTISYDTGTVGHDSGITYSETTYETPVYSGSVATDVTYSGDLYSAPVYADHAGGEIATSSYESVVTTTLHGGYESTEPAYHGTDTTGMIDTGAYSGGYVDSSTTTTHYETVVGDTMSSHGGGMTYDPAPAPSYEPAPAPSYEVTQDGYIVSSGATTEYAAPATDLGGGAGLLGPNSTYGSGFEPVQDVYGGQYQVIDSGVSGAGSYSAPAPAYVAPASSTEHISGANTSDLDLIFLGN